MVRPVGREVARLVGDRWTLLLVRDMRAAPGGSRISSGAAGIPPNILSDRLKLMDEHRLVTRRFYSDHPPRAEYVLTDKGRELGVVVGALAAWGSRHVHRQTALVHAECGHPVEVKYFCPQCAGRVRGATVELRRRSAGPRRAAKRS
jgi:DNA-binding HxlR family transcriptional regulator